MGTCKARFLVFGVRNGRHDGKRWRPEDSLSKNWVSRPTNDRLSVRNVSFHGQDIVGEPTYRSEIDRM
jgi:hypothetical protein